MTDDRLDLQAYLRRIGFDGPLGADLETLSGLIRHHAANIPFENIEVLADRVPQLDLGSLQRKLVQQRRGGYCFEQNNLFLACLREIGFEARGLEARVRANVAPDVITARTHMAIEVRLRGQRYLADVGFGGLAPLIALPMDATEQAGPDGAVHRHVSRGDSAERGEQALQIRGTNGWDDCYHIAAAAPQPIDFEMANWFVATHAIPMLRHNLLVARAVEGGRLTLFNHELTLRRGAAAERRTVRDRSEMAEVLADRFGLSIDADSLDRVMDVLARIEPSTAAA